LEKPIFTYLKNVEKSTRKMRLPIDFVRKYGNSYYMEVYDGYIILKPTGAKNGKCNDKH